LEEKEIMLYIFPYKTYEFSLNLLPT
jgi:hypothetical protein